MTDPTSAQRAREWLERQLAELGQLRNASRRDSGFKAWRQNTLTVLQRIWPEDAPRIERFRRIPFSPPMQRPTERQVREYFGRGWGEAGQYLRSLLSEVALLGVRDSAALEEPATAAQLASAAALEMGPVIDMPAEPKAAPPAPARATGERPAAAPTGDAPPVTARPPSAETPAIDRAAPEVPDDAEPPLSADEIGREMARFMSTSPVFRRVIAAPAPVAPPPAPPPASVVDLTLLATEIESLGLAPGDVPAAREALLAVARAAQRGTPDWDLVREALRQAAGSPALARRAVPLLMAFLEQAA